MKATALPYERAGQALLDESGCVVRTYRTSMNGRAFTRSDDWGIEVPHPHGPISFGVFAHEVGHQMLHRHGSRPRWLEELEAWEYALFQFPRFGLAGHDRARDSAAKSLVYAAVKANRRGNAETAQRILDRFPVWVWYADSGCAIAGAEIEESAAITGRQRDVEGHRI
jgi:hypothetical protein